MYLGDISKALLIRDNVSVITNMKYSHFNWKLVTDYKSNYLLK